MSRSAAEPKSRSALREISLVISFNGPSFLLSLLLLLRSRSSLFLFGLWVGAVGATERERGEERGVLIQIRNPARDEDDGVADVSLILLRVGRWSSVPLSPLLTVV